MTYTVSSGALNSTPTNQPISNSERSQCAPTIIIIMQRLTRHVDHKDDESQALSSPGGRHTDRQTHIPPNVWKFVVIGCIYTLCSKKGRRQTCGGNSVNSQPIFNILHCQTQILQWICSKVFIKDPTASHVRRGTTLWNICQKTSDSRRLLQ